MHTKQPNTIDPIVGDHVQGNRIAGVVEVAAWRGNMGFPQEELMAKTDRRQACSIL